MGKEQKMLAQWSTVKEWGAKWGQITFDPEALAGLWSAAKSLQVGKLHK